jgi:hypothetical protein
MSNAKHTCLAADDNLLVAFDLAHLSTLFVLVKNPVQFCTGNTHTGKDVCPQQTNHML